jgi:hypothetical protein
MDAADAMTGEPAAEDGPTRELRVGGTPAATRPGGFLSGVAGVGLCVLWIMAVGLVVAQIVSAGQDRPGPGAFAVGSHVLAALVGVGCYRAVRGGRGLARLLGLCVLSVVLVVLLWFFWWSPAR